MPDTAAPPTQSVEFHLTCVEDGQPEYQGSWFADVALKDGTFDPSALVAALFDGEEREALCHLPVYAVEARLGRIVLARYSAVMGEVRVEPDADRPVGLLLERVEYEATR